MAVTDAIRWLKTAQPEMTEKDKNRRRLVMEIIEKVRENGMAGVRDFSRQFDGFGGPFRVPPSHAQKALADMGPKLRSAFELCIANVRDFHSRQKEFLKSREWELGKGVFAGLKFLPVDSVAVHVPSGRYPMPSSAIMAVVPAQVAGVRRIAAFSTPNSDGAIYQSVLAVLALLGVEEIWAIGGAHAVGAFAYGADELEKVDFISGLGNSFVLEAKRAVAGNVGVDLFGGANETMMIADSSCDPVIAATDLIAQVEYDPQARCTLVCTDEIMARRVIAEAEKLLHHLTTRSIAEVAWTYNGLVGVAKDLDAAVAFANERAPEHLHLSVLNPNELLKKCTAYGAAYIGSETPEVFGDYIAGINHILPTNGRARFSGGMWVGTFMRTMTHLEMSKDAIRDLAEPGILIAESEGLMGHVMSFRAHSDSARL